MAKNVPRESEDSLKSSEILKLQQALYASKNPTRRWLHNRRRLWVEQAIKSNSKSGVGTALEIGPGSGLYLPLLSKCFDNVVATDVEETFLQNITIRGKEFEGVCCLNDDISRTKLQPATFDLILCSEIIEHIEDVEAALHNMRMILKRDGTLILTTPHKYCPLEVCSKVAYLPGIIDLVRRIYREPILDAGHINLMTSSALRRLVKKSGFTIQMQESFGCYIPIIAEFAGNLGLSIEQKTEKTISGTLLEGLLWTQAYILRP